MNTYKTPSQTQRFSGVFGIFKMQPSENTHNIFKNGAWEFFSPYTYARVFNYPVFFACIKIKLNDPMIQILKKR